MSSSGLRRRVGPAAEVTVPPDGEPVPDGDPAGGLGEALNGAHDDDPTLEELVPAAQAAQVEAPAEAENCPAGHGVQVDAKAAAE